ncbi:RNA-directed DNA polymerase, eukaryota [Tanacetum coccineum]|uniref:RNA-directed DNA polymerase, eukaryota n=1 Tax=Tanacetum coccineum TaxID=301880 RepID=A0ABQ5I1Z7_9ASTR
MVLAQRPGKPIIRHQSCGLSAISKHSWISDVILEEHLDAIGIQETKMEYIDLDFIRRIWGFKPVDYVFGPSVSSSGGTLLMWNYDVLCKESVYVNPHFLRVLGKWYGITEKVHIITIYAPQGESQKESL